MLPRKIREARFVTRIAMAFLGLVAASICFCHFSAIGLLDGPAAAVAGAVNAIGQEEEQPDHRTRYDYQLSEIIELSPQDKAAKLYDNWRKKGGGDVGQLMFDLYNAAGNNDKAFKKVAGLIAKGVEVEGADGKLTRVQIPDDHSVAMAKQRDKWIQETFDKVIADYGAKGQEIRIATSDSGNVTSGMKSDLDQTVYVFKKNANSAWERMPKMDAEVRGAFETTWKDSPNRPSLDALDIATIPGMDRFPDPREVTIVEHGKEYRTTIENLRRTPGAYTTQGAVGQQMQFRALKAIFKARAAGEERPRVFRMSGPNGDRLPFDPDFAIRTMFGRQPELMPGYAFGAAVANFYELQKYMDLTKHAKFESKYHLRVWEDTNVPLHIAQEGQTKDVKVEYIDLPLEERMARNDKYLNEMFAYLPEAERAKKVQMHKIAMEISGNLRREHKGAEHVANIEIFNGNPPGDAEARKVEIFRELGQTVYKDKYSGTPEQLKDLDVMYRSLASEFCLESVMHSSEEAVRFLNKARGGPTDLFDLEGYRHLLSETSLGNWQKFKANMADGLRLTLYYSFYDLSKFGKDGLLSERIKKKFPDMAAEIEHMRQVAMLADLRSAFATPKKSGLGDAFRERTRQFIRTELPDLNQRVQQHIALQLGFENVELTRTVYGLLETRHLSWKMGKFVKNMAYDPGNVTAVVEIMRVFLDTDGDPEAVGSAILREMFFTLPFTGQVATALSGDAVGMAMVLGGMQYQIVGKAIFWIGLAQTVFAIVDQQYLTPSSDNTVDAMYRGFIGPPTRYFGKAPRHSGKRPGNSPMRTKHGSMISVRG